MAEIDAPVDLPASELRAAPGRVELSMDAIDTYYFAASHRNVVRQVSIRNVDVPEDAGEIVITVAVESPLASPPLHAFVTAIPAFPPRDQKVLQMVRMEPDHRVLVLLDEQVQGNLVVTATISGQVVGTARHPITFLAFNQWMFRPEYYDSLAAFVQPNSPAIRPVLTRAGELLGERTGSDATEGYQAGAGRAVEIAEAVYDALREQNLRYTNPPASFEGYGQKVRTPEVVMAERAATCLDSSVLYTSCLMALGLEAYLVVVQGHAFAAFWDGESGDEYESLLRTAVVEDRNQIALLQRAGRFTPVETTTFTSRRDEVSFAEAAREDLSYFTGIPEDLRAVINVEYARAHGVPPIPSAQALSGPALADGPVGAEWAGAPLRPDIPAISQVTSGVGCDTAPRQRTTDATADAPPRIRAWLRSLLDLSFANPLLRLGGRSGGRGTFELVLPPGLLGGLEDRLMSTGSIEILTAPDAPTSLRRDPDDIEVAGSILADSGRVFWPELQQYELALDQVRSQIKEAESDLPPAEIENLAVRFLRDAYGKDIERGLGALRRKAREIEAQTGVNTLFLAFGTLKWAEAGGRRGASEQGRAPLFLVPVRITGKASTGFRISTADAADVIPNYCLLEKLRQTYNITIEDLERPLTDDAGIDVDHMIAKVREALGQARVRDAVVVEDAHLAILNFSTFRLWKDMRDSWPIFMESPVVKHLVATPNETFDDALIPGEGEDSPAEADDIPCPIDCDQSQLEAVRWSSEGRSFVLEGPPGTGKSQTIANLLAANIAAGKKILFVAEKRAALEVVKKRLDRVGLGPFCLDLHDKGSKPEQIREQIKNSLDLVPIDREAQWQELNARWSADRSVLAGYRDALHAPGPAGLTAWTANQERLRVAGDGPPAVDVPRTFLEGALTALPRVRDAMLSLPRVTGAGSIEPEGAWSLCAVEDFDQLDTIAIGTAAQTLAKLGEALRGSNELQSLLADLDGPESLSQTVQLLDLWVAGQLLSEADASLTGSPEWLAMRDQALALLDSTLAGQQQILSVFTPDIYNVDLTAPINAGIEATTAGVFSKAKKARIFQATVAPWLRAADGPPSDDLLRVLQTVAPAAGELAKARQAIASIPGVSLPPGWNPLDPGGVASLRTRLAEIATQVQLQQSPQASRLRSHLQTVGPLRHDAVDLLRSISDWWRHFHGLLTVTPESQQRWRGTRTFIEAWTNSEANWTEALPRLLPLQRWCQVLAAVRPLRDAGLDHVARAILDGELDPSEAYEQFHVGFIETAIEERLEAGRIDLFDGRAHDRRIEDFIVRDMKRKELLQDRIPAQLVEQRPVHGRKRIGKWGALEQELERRSRKLSIRRLVAEYGEILPDLTPCFLMSPDSVARFVPAGAIEFDLVVFDEASQIEVPKAIGAMGRAKAVVVVGDTKQMPPSQFGGTSAAPDDDLDPEDETLYEDLESILSECVESNIPRLYLQCHYRSRHEALIAFSNRHFYEGRLTTFPSPAGPQTTPILWRRIEGQFDRTAGEFNRTNRTEAEAIAKEIISRVNSPATHDQSIGVVTLNATQQALVIRLLEESGDERVKALLEDDGENGLIVRNLESVQGDERDVILLSVAFAPPQSVDASGNPVRGRLGLNFGPINKQGGERRLNVAVTRARAEVVVFCSFDPEEMNLTENSSLGLQLLKGYLQGARDGVARSADLVGRAPTPPDLHRAEIAAALRERGLKVQENIGLSTFRVDLAVGREDDDEWPVAVLLDGPGWAGRSTVYDRDALPTNVLHNAMGWKRVHRVWFPMWLHARSEVLDDIVAQVELAHEPSTARTDAEQRVEEASRELPVAEGANNVTADTSQAAQLTGNPGAPNPPLVGPEPELSNAAASGSSTELADEVDPSADRPTPADLLAELPERGDKYVLDDVARGANNAAVREAAMEVLLIAAPISASALAKLVGGQFGYAQVRQNRIETILACVPDDLLRPTDFGTFVWHPTQDPESFVGCRGEDEYGAARPVDQVAPEELRNAMVELARQGVVVSEEELIRHTAELFGTRRLTAGIRAHLAAVLEWVVDTGRLTGTDGAFRCPAD